ncbi:unnamed protein product [Camellia sinensis]
MAHPENDEKKHELNRDLYSALMRGDGNKVIEHCRKIPHGPLHILTIHNDTALHMATYSKQKQLVLELLQLLPDKDRKMIMAENDIGNTILHEAATGNRIVLAAKEMLRKTPKLLRKKSKRGERDCSFPSRPVRENGDVQTEGCREFYQRDDNTTILHISILTEHFEVAIVPLLSENWKRVEQVCLPYQCVSNVHPYSGHCRVRVLFLHHISNPCVFVVVGHLGGHVIVTVWDTHHDLIKFAMSAYEVM